MQVMPGGGVLPKYKVLTKFWVGVCDPDFGTLRVIRTDDETLTADQIS